MINLPASRWGSKSLNMSSCDFKKVVCEFGDGFSIVAFEK